MLHEQSHLELNVLGSLALFSFVPLHARDQHPFVGGEFVIRPHIIFWPNLAQPFNIPLQLTITILDSIFTKTFSTYRNCAVSSSQKSQTNDQRTAGLN